MSRKLTVRLKSKPIPLLPEYRIEYKVCMLVLILFFSCRNNKGSIKKINYIMNALCTFKSMMHMDESTKVENVSCDFDKTLIKVLKIAVIDDIIVIRDGQLELLDSGHSLVQLILNNNIFIDEVNLLKNKKKNFITENIFK